MKNDITINVENNIPEEATPKKRRGRPKKSVSTETPVVNANATTVENINNEEDIEANDINIFDMLTDLTAPMLKKRSIKQYNISRFSARQIVNRYYNKQDSRLVLTRSIHAIKSSLELAKENMEKYDNDEITLDEIFNKKFPSYTNQYQEYIMDIARKYENISDCDDIKILEKMEFIEKANESAYKYVMEKYAESHPIGRWLMSITGIGPVIAVGLLSHIDIYKCPTVGHIWSYAGWCGTKEQYIRYDEFTRERISFEDPRFDWDEYKRSMMSERRERGRKTTWNPEFRTLLFKIGESFIKCQNREGEGAIYGHIYKEKLAELVYKNDMGGFKYKAKAELECRKFDKNSELYKTYSSGKLSKSHLINMAKRYTVKIFLSHLHEVWYEYEFGKKVPNPFPVLYLGHTHIIKCPNKEIVFGDNIIQ